MSTPRSVKGMRDLLPPETAVWAAVEETARRVFALYGFSEIRTPIVEETELFVRSVGESTDIVGKEMYTFEDKGGRSLTLRPESTAPVARAFVEHGLRELHYPQRLFYIGPQFRYERPQKGRYRQFHQIGAEVFDDPHEAADVDLVLLLMRFLGELGFSDLVVRLNTVGTREDREAYARELRAFLEDRIDDLSEDSRRRLTTNPLRILDTKVPREREILEEAPTLRESFCAESLERFERVCELLDGRVDYAVDPRLVRGLDYYSHTVFEIASESLGAQDAIVGGGRYDGLVSSLGGPDTAGFGFAIGQDRLIEVIPAGFRARVAAAAPITLVALTGDERGGTDLVLAEELRAWGIPVVAELGKVKLKLALKRAERRGSRHVLLLGDDELRDGTVTVKDFETGQQETVPRDRLASYLEERR